jgi:hypothetical protein
MLRDTVEAPTASPSSLEENDSGDEHHTTPNNLQLSEDSDLTGEPVENLDAKEEIAFESVV